MKAKHLLGERRETLWKAPKVYKKVKNSWIIEKEVNKMNTLNVIAEFRNDHRKVRDSLLATLLRPSVKKTLKRLGRYSGS